MKVFVTGASGWIGSATVDELLAAGHEVTGLVRSDASADALAAKGATPLRGDLDDLGALRSGAEAADAVVHLGNKHDWSDQRATDRTERTAVQTMVDVLKGSDRAFALASGLALLAEDRPALESDASPARGLDSMRGGTENLALDAAADGVRSIALRFAPTVHGMRDHGFVALVADTARRTGFSGWIGDGSHAWAAVHRADAARLVRLGIERAPAGSRLHAVAEEGVPTRAIAEALGRSLGLPSRSVDREEAAAHFGFMARFFGADLRASSVATRDLLGWEPSGPTLIEDIDAGAYAEPA